MKGPKRWRDDPSVLEELGLDLNAERASLKQHDLDAMQHVVEAKIATGATASVLPYLIGALIVAGAAVAFWPSSPVERPPLPAPPVTTNVEIEQVRMVAKPSVAESTKAPKAIVRKRSNETSVETVVAEAPSAEQIAAPTSSDLAAQLEVYERAQKALAEDRAREATEAFDAYLSRYPEGRLVVEARLGLLHAHFASEAYSKTETLAVELLESPLATHRRAEILRVLGESRALRGACAAASTALDAAHVAEETKRRALERCKTIAQKSATN